MHDQQIDAQEAVLRRVRDALKDTPLFAGAVFADVRHPSGGVALQDVRFTDESDWTWQQLYGYLREGRIPTRPCDWMRLETADRLNYIRYLPVIAAALEGEHVSLTEDASWRWRRGAESTRPGGASQYEPRYSLLICFGARAPCDAARFLAGAAVRCASPDPRADRNLFEQIGRASPDLLVVGQAAS